jgi:hypothetical protein
LFLSPGGTIDQIEGNWPMHLFSELVDRCVRFTLWKLAELQEQTNEELQTSGATRLVKNLKMVQMQKAIMVVGMFSLLESFAQR